MVSLGAKRVHQSSEDKHRNNVGKQNGARDNDRELLEHVGRSPEHAHARAESRQGSADDAHPHQLVGALHSVVAVVAWGSVVLGSQVNNVVNGKSDDDDSSKRFGDSKLPPL